MDHQLKIAKTANPDAAPWEKRELLTHPEVGKFIHFYRVLTSIEDRFSLVAFCDLLSAQAPFGPIVPGVWEDFVYSLFAMAQPHEVAELLLERDEDELHEVGEILETWESSEARNRIAQGLMH